MITPGGDVGGTVSGTSDVTDSLWETTYLAGLAPL